MSGLKNRIIDIEAHALFRVLERGSEFGLDYYETKERAFKTARLGRLAKKQISKKNKTYYLYFKNNLSFYVVCQEKEFEDYVKRLIRTVIIEKGRM